MEHVVKDTRRKEQQRGVEVLGRRMGGISQGDIWVQTCRR